ncbi:MAG: MarR family transcriptional regulator [Clostridia bacterium]|nr:MarR family transcriptional regulator [Clostridia bacterium]
MQKNSCQPLKPGRLINEISKLFHDRIKKQSDDLGFKNGYHQILRFLVREDGVTQIDIVKDSHFKAPTISVTLKKMEEEGLVRRETDKIDMRQTRVYITEKGRELDRKLFAKVMECEDILAQTISEEEQAFLCDILKKMRSNLLEIADGTEGGTKK